MACTAGMLSIERREKLQSGNIRLSISMASKVILLKRNIFSLNIKKMPGTKSKMSRMADLMA